MKAEKIRQIVKLKRVINLWKEKTLFRRSDESESDASGLTRRVQPGFLAVYVGHEPRRFVIPTRFLKFPVFVELLKKAEEEFGFPGDGGLVLPCDAAFFRRVLKLLESDERRFSRFGVEEILKFVAEVGFDVGLNQAVTPLLGEAKF